MHKYTNALALSILYFHFARLLLYIDIDMLKFKCHYIMRWGTVESNATEAIHIIYVYDSTCIDN